MFIHQTECLFTMILINTTNLRHFTLLYAILLPFAPLCAPLRYFTLLYSTLLYLGTSLWPHRFFFFSTNKYDTIQPRILLTTQYSAIYETCLQLKRGTGNWLFPVNIGLLQGLFHDLNGDWHYQEVALFHNVISFRVYLAPTRNWFRFQWFQQFGKPKLLSIIEQNVSVFSNPFNFLTWKENVFMTYWSILVTSIDFYTPPLFISCHKVAGYYVIPTEKCWVSVRSSASA